MVNRASQGPVQVFSLDLSTINLALRDLSERLDALKGLRGRSEIFDRMRVDSPAQLSDAIDLGSLDDREALFHLTLHAGGGAALVAQPASTSYVEIGEGLRQRINFATPVGLEARMLLQGVGTESGNAKSVALADLSNNVVADVTWDGTDVGFYAGEFTAVALDEDQVVQVQAKGSTTTESLILYGLAVEFRFAGGATVDT